MESLVLASASIDEHNRFIAKFFKISLKKKDNQIYSGKKKDNQNYVWQAQKYGFAIFPEKL
jgi:hypothetical protein